MADQFKQLAIFACLTLTEPTPARLLELIAHYDLEVDSTDPAWPEQLTWVALLLVEGQTLAQVGVIDFTDMIVLPVTMDLPCPQYDYLFLDEAQDLNATQAALFLRCCRQGRILAIGDKHQFQPATTQVRMADGMTERPIEDLHPGDQVVGYDRPSQMFVKHCTVSAVAARQYDGLLYSVSAGGKTSRCTDSHTWLVR